MNPEVHVRGAGGTCWIVTEWESEGDGQVLVAVKLKACEIVEHDTAA